MTEVYDWACIADGKVQMVVRWDGVTKWPPSEEYTMVDLTETPWVGIGWDWDGENFIDNRPTEEYGDI